LLSSNRVSEERRESEDWGLLGLRVGIGFVFVTFGLEKLLDPMDWAMFVPPWFDDLRRLAGEVPLDRVVRCQGVTEMGLGLHLLLGVGTRIAAAMASLFLVMVIAVLGWNPLAVRDLGLAAGAFALFMTGPGRFSLSAVVGHRAGATMAGTTPLWAVSYVAILVVVLGAPSSSGPSLGATVAAADVTGVPIPPLPRTVAVDRQKADLGRLLFDDPRLSLNNTVSCATCHSQRGAGGDGRIVSIGIDGQLGTRNAPTVFNAALNVAQFWDGRAATLEEQAGGPITKPLEMHNTWPEVLARLRADPRYVSLFGVAYADGITEANVRHAIAEFERTLVTPDAPFDRFLRGDEAALTPEQKRGWERFRSLGCVVCHQGANAGGNLFQIMGRMRQMFDDKTSRGADLGRFTVTGREEDRYRFRVPPLRNVELTAPYFHDGSVSELPQAVRIMARHQLGYELGDGEVTELVAFLQSLTGKAPQL
jgi:cytochrome c peroxidase